MLMVVVVTVVVDLSLLLLVPDVREVASRVETLRRQMRVDDGSSVVHAESRDDLVCGDDAALGLVRAVHGVGHGVEASPAQIVLARVLVQKWLRLGGSAIRNSNIQTTGGASIDSKGRMGYAM